MKRSLVLVVALLATACAGPTPPDRWTVERHVPSEADDSPIASICDDIEALALGSLAAETDIGPALGELARVGAVVGATESLPLLAQAGEADDPAAALAAAAVSLDDAGYAECEVPIFTALYVTTSWASCFGRVDIAADTLIGDVPAGTCNAADSPGFLPCWDAEGGYLPLDCRTGEPVRAVAGAWQPV